MEPPRRRLPGPAARRRLPGLSRHRPFRPATLLAAVFALLAAETLAAQGRPNRPVLHGRHWAAVTGKPLGAEAGARMFRQGGNAVDAAAAMLAATSTMWDVLSWGGETQALIWHPEERRVYGINAVGVAPTGATPEFFKEQGIEYPPAFGPLAAVTPGTPGGLMVMLARFGTLSLADVLRPAIEMAEGYPIEEGTADRIEGSRDQLERWRYSREVMLPHLAAAGDTGRAAPYPGEVFRQPDLQRTLERLVEAERRALEEGATREDAIMAAYDRFYRGDIAEELVRGAREEGALITLEDLDEWEVEVEAPDSTTYEDYTVYKLTSWTQGPAMLQALNMLEPLDVREMGYNSARYIHALYQVMNHAFADRDFYYGDPYVAPEEPMAGLLSKAYARARLEGVDWERNDPDVRPGNPYAFQEGEHPFPDLLASWTTVDTVDRGVPGDWEDWRDSTAAEDDDGNGAGAAAGSDPGRPGGARVDARREEAGDGLTAREAFRLGTTSIQAADSTGWFVSVTPSGGWVPAVIAGRTGVGLSQRMQSFVVHEEANPYNVVAPGKRPRVTLTPTIVTRDGQPWLAVSVQGGDTQDQNLLQFFLNMVEFGMGPQEAAEAANITSYQMRGSFDQHESQPGVLELNEATPPWVREELASMGYDLSYRERTSGPITAIWWDGEHGTFWGAASDYGDDYGIAW